VRGLDEFPRDVWPNVRNVHFAFQAMVGLGTLVALVSAAALGQWWIRRRPLPRPLLRAVLLASPGGFLALEAGWLVTEWGRQPFTVWGVLRTAESVTPVGGLAWPFALFTLLYLFLAAMVIVLLRRQIARSPSLASGVAAHARDGRPYSAERTT
jgi:cytochrome d ubiquinol oxidase subunit I